MGVNSRELDEYGYALCNVCKKKYSLNDLVEKCEFCGKWFCRNCAKPTPPGHGHGKICKNCYARIKKEDREK